MKALVPVLEGEEAEGPSSGLGGHAAAERRRQGWGVRIVRGVLRAGWPNLTDPADYGSRWQQLKVLGTWPCRPHGDAKEWGLRWGKSGIS